MFKNNTATFDSCLLYRLFTRITLHMCLLCLAFRYFTLDCTYFYCCWAVDWYFLGGVVFLLWILKNSKYLVDYIQFMSLSSCNSIKTFDFSSLYTTIPHSNLKDKWGELVQLCFIKKYVQRRYTYLVLGRDRSYFAKHHSDSTKRFSENDIFNMLEFLIDHIFAMFGGRVFNRQSAYLWIQTALLFSPTCSFIRMRQTSYRGISRKTKRI